VARKCPDCGELLKVSVEHVTLVTDKPAIAAPRWDCANCGWSLAFNPGDPPAGP